MSIAEEEADVYGSFSRPVATALNFFSMLRFEGGRLGMPGLVDDVIDAEKVEDLRKYVKQTMRELRTGELVSPGDIQRRMYWFMSKVIEYGGFPGGKIYRLMSFYQISSCELDY